MERVVPVNELDLCYRPISAAIFVKDDENEYFTDFIKNTPLENRLRITLYQVLPMEKSNHQCVVYYIEIDPIADEAKSFDESIVYGTLYENGYRRRYKRICNDNSEPIYPINRLRNIAINNIETTHFLVIDMDMWPVGRLFEDFDGFSFDGFSFDDFLSTGFFQWFSR